MPVAAVLWNVRIVSLGDAHKLDGVASLSVGVVDQAQLTICFLYLRNLSTLAHDPQSTTTTQTCTKLLIRFTFHLGKRKTPIFFKTLPQSRVQISESTEETRTTHKYDLHLHILPQVRLTSAHFATMKRGHLPLYIALDTRSGGHS